MDGVSLRVGLGLELTLEPDGGAGASRACNHHQGEWNIAEIQWIWYLSWINFCNFRQELSDLIPYLLAYGGADKDLPQRSLTGL